MESRTGANRILQGILPGLVLILAAGLRFYALDRLPPGLFTDEAFNGMTASRILDAGDVQPFYAANSGREGLFFFLLAAAIRLGGHTSLALRSVSAAVGTLTVLLTYVVLRSFFAEERHGRWTALLAAGAMAVSYWHLNFSRIAFRAILLPPFALLALGLFLHAWRRNALRNYVLAGLILGLSLYTYLAARLLPIVVLGFIVLEAAIVGRRNVQAWLVRRVALLFAVAFLVAGPLLVYFAVHPETFGLRSGSVFILTAPNAAASGGPVAWLASNAVSVADMFYVRGDANPRHNIPGRPALDPWTAALFTVGLLVASARLGRPAYRLLLLWLAVMLLPVILSTDAPNSLRALGALPAVCSLIGVGGTWLAGRLAVLIHQMRATEPGMALCLLLTLGLSGRATIDGYFVRWPQHNDVPFAFDDHWRRQAQAIHELADTGDLYVPAEIFTQPVVRFLLYERYSRLVVPAEPVDLAGLRQPHVMLSLEHPPQGPFVLLTTGEEPVARSLGPVAGKDWAALSAALASRVTAAPKVADSSGREIAVVLPLAAAELTLLPRENRPTYPLERRFANGVRLRGYSLEPDAVSPGGRFNLTLFWQADHLLEDNFEVFVHLTDRAGRVQSQANGPPTAGFHPGALWSAGEVVADVRTVVVPVELPEGKVRFEVGMLRPDLRDRVAILNEAGRPAADQVLLGAATVTRQPTDGFGAARPTHPLNVRFGPSILLAGYDLAGESRPGGNLQVTLHWQALDRLDADWTVFVHLVGADGQLVAQHDQPPQAGADPTSWWVPGEEIDDPLTLAIPNHVLPGPYTLRVGLYLPHNGRRLPCEAGCGTTRDDYVTLSVLIGR